MSRYNDASWRVGMAPLKDDDDLDLDEPEPDEAPRVATQERPLARYALFILSFLLFIMLLSSLRELLTSPSPLSSLQSEESFLDAALADAERQLQAEEERLDEQERLERAQQREEAQEHARSHDEHDEHDEHVEAQLLRANALLQPQTLPAADNVNVAHEIN